MVHIPPYIHPGDTVGVVSTASIIVPEVVEPAIELLQSLGYKVVVGKHLYDRYHQFAGTDLQRAADFQIMLDNPDIKTIFCSRGGYGSLRTAELINWQKFINKPKWIVGFSDITALQAKVNQLGIASIHGVMPRYFLQNEQTSQSFQYLLDALNGKNLSYEIEKSQYNRVGTASGPVIGGNLSMLYSLRGTPYDFDPKGKILFIEDLAEYLYHLDRMMMNLKVGGQLEGLAGLLVGQFTGMKDHETKFGKTVEEIIYEAVAEYQYPVLFNFQAGHHENNFPIKLGVEGLLKVSDSISTFIQ